MFLNYFGQIWFYYINIKADFWERSQKKWRGKYPSLWASPKPDITYERHSMAAQLSWPSFWTTGFILSPSFRFPASAFTLPFRFNVVNLAPLNKHFATSFCPRLLLSPRWTYTKKLTASSPGKNQDKWSIFTAAAIETFTSSLHTYTINGYLVLRRINTLENHQVWVVSGRYTHRGVKCSKGCVCPQTPFVCMDSFVR